MEAVENRTHDLWITRQECEQLFDLHHGLPEQALTSNVDDDSIAGFSSRRQLQPGWWLPTAAAGLDSGATEGGNLDLERRKRVEEQAQAIPAVAAGSDSADDDDHCFNDDNNNDDDAMVCSVTDNDSSCRRRRIGQRPVLHLGERVLLRSKRLPEVLQVRLNFP